MQSFDCVQLAFRTRPDQAGIGHNTPTLANMADHGPIWPIWGPFGAIYWHVQITTDLYFANISYHGPILDKMDYHRPGQYWTTTLQYIGLHGPILANVGHHGPLLRSPFTRENPVDTSLKKKKNCKCCYKFQTNHVIPLHIPSLSRVDIH